jgi:hypothetical protein
MMALLHVARAPGSHVSHLTLHFAIPAAAQLRPTNTKVKDWFTRCSNVAGGLLPFLCM